MESTDDPFIKAYIRMYGIDRARFSSLKDELRQKATLLYMVDYFENKRELYF
jgi:acetoin utilization protein AcuB